MAASPSTITRPDLRALDPVPELESAPAPRLVAENVSVHFGSRMALHDVSVGFRGGETVALVGPNGAGKSTLLKVLAGMLRPSHGGVVRHAIANDRTPRVSYVPQRSGVDWTFPVDVLDVVLMGAPVGGPLARLLPFRGDPPSPGAGGAGSGRDVRVRPDPDRRAVRRPAATRLPRPGADAGRRHPPARRALHRRRHPHPAPAARPAAGPVRARQDGHLRHPRPRAGPEAADRVLLVNGTIVADGAPQTVLTPAALRATFGGQVIILTDASSGTVTETVG